MNIRGRAPLRLLLMVIAVCWAFGSFASGQSSRDAKMAAFREAKYGLFIHWGLYALPAGVWQGNAVRPSSEWIMAHARIPVQEYEQLAKQFNAAQFDAEQWVKIAQDAGMKYLVITAKHGDGFAMYRSKVTPYNIYDATPFHRDPLRELAEACARHGMKLGLYYSQSVDWHEPGGEGNSWDFGRDREKDQSGAFDRYLQTKVEPQVRELLTNYGPICELFFDTPALMTAPRAQRIADLVHSIQPACLIDGRLGVPGDYLTMGDNGIPSSSVGTDWETPGELNHNWGFDQNDADYKSPSQVLFNLFDVVSKGGNYLLDVGPTAAGVIPEVAAANLATAGRWLKVNGEAVYGAGLSPFGEGFGGFGRKIQEANGKTSYLPFLDWRCTTKPGKLYFTIFHWPSKGFNVPAFQNRISRAYLLGDPDRVSLPIDVAANGERHVTMAHYAPDVMASVLVMEIEGGQAVLPVKTAATTAAQAPAAPLHLQQAFTNPADDCRIRVRWWWFGPAVTTREIEREMRVMKAGGIGGFEVEPTYPLALDGEIPGLKNLKFMSPEFLAALHFTAAKAKELGLEMDLTLGSGWPYGGPQFSTADSATALRTQDLPVTPGQGTAALPALPAGQTVIAAFAQVGSSFQRLRVERNAVRLPDGAATLSKVQLYIQRGGIMAVKRPAFGDEGRVIDHYSPASVDKFLREIAGPEIEACGPNPPYSVFCDSLEVSGENWTPNLLAEFKRKRGYDLEPLLPALFADAGPKTLEVRHDWGQTVTELYNEYFNRRVTQFAHREGTRFRVQGYGTPPAGLYSYADCDLPEGEGSEWKKFSATRWSSSAVHLLGESVASSETFTWLHSPVFRATPLDMKGEADRHFLSGINQIVCHGWPYTAEGVGYPGWSFYASGVFDEKNPWWLVMPDVTKYLQRVSSVLRQGSPANDVAVYLPNDDAWTDLGRGFGLSSTLGNKVSGLVGPIIDAGYNLDFFDDPLLAMRGKAEGNAIAFGMVRYPIVVLPAIERMPLATLRTLERFARGGGTLIAIGRLPDRAPGYLATEAETAEVKQIVQRLFKDANAPGILLDDSSLLGAALAKRLAPDVAIVPAAPEIGFVHRHTADGEIYFVANTSNEPKQVQASFRIAGVRPEIWDPMNGRLMPARVVSRSLNLTTIELRLAAYGSTLVAFVPRSLAGSGVEAGGGGGVAHAGRRDAAVGTGTSADAAGAQSGAGPGILPLELSGSWSVRFGARGAPVVMDRLTSWSEVPGQEHFSGVATYEKTVEVGPELLTRGLPLSFDFGPSTVVPDTGRLGGGGYRAALIGPVREAAVLYINGERIGSVWAPPYSLDITGRLKAGQNQIRIEVANLAINYLAGIPLPTYNYAGVTARYGDRFQPQELGLIRVLPAGLLGPVRIVARAVGD